VKRLLFALGIALLLLGSLHQLNAGLMSLSMGAGRSVLRPLALAAAFVLGALCLWFASVRAHRESTPRVLALTWLVVVGAGYAGHLAFVPVHRFGGAVTATPLEEIEENYPRRGAHTYRVNGYGFRGPAWQEVKAPGTVRGVVIGDSMVFGSGVADDETIDATLARRLRDATLARRPRDATLARRPRDTRAGTAIEIINLGVQGSNMPAYVELYRAATDRLAPDFVVVFLFLPNDLGELEQPSQLDRVGLFSFFAFLVGTSNNPYTLWAMRASDARSDAAKLAFLEEHIRALEDVRRARGSTPLFVFLYHLDDPRWVETVRRQLGAGAWIVDHDPLPEADFIPDDGHPTAEGNRHFAALVGDAVERAGVLP
jgi:hypothetical protein